MPNRRLVKDPERYKTVLCAGWSSTGACSYGRKCQFAHGREELRVRTAPPLSSLEMQQSQALAGMYGMQPPLPHAPMAMWPAQPQVAGLRMPPLPPGPPPPHSGLLLNPQQLASAPGMAPPIPVSGPLPGNNPMSEYQAALLTQAAALQTAAAVAAAQQQQQMAATRHQLQHTPPLPPQMPHQLGHTTPLGGPLECQPALIAPTPNTTPPQLPAAILPSNMPTPAPLPAPHHNNLPGGATHPPQQHPQQPTSLLPHALPAAMAPAAEPPLPLPSLTPPSHLAMAPAAEAVTPMTSGVSGGGGGAAAARPHNLTLTTPVEIDNIWAARTPELGKPFDLMKSTKESGSSTNNSICGPCDTESSSTATASGADGLRDQTNVFSSIGELWSPLKADGSSKPPTLWPDSGGLRVERLSENSTDKLDKLCLDSPGLEPSLAKRDMSFQSGVVRRMTSFLFDDPASPLHSAENSRHGVSGSKSPHTAIAA